MNYNEEYIKSFDEQSYQDILNSMDKLDFLYKNWINKYTDDNIDAKAILLKESLDNYILKMITIDSNFINSKQMYNYIIFITKIYNYDNLEFSTNVVFKNDYSRKLIVSKFYSKYSQIIIKINNDNKSKFNIILNKIKNNENIDQEELNFVCKFLSRLKIDKDDKFDILLSYIFGNMKNTNLKVTYQVLDFILSRIPFFYSEEFNIPQMKGVRYSLGNSYDNQSINVPGYSYNLSNFVVVNKGLFSNVNISSINDSSKERLELGNDITFFIIFAFHEITHQYQDILSKKDDLNDVGLAAVISYVLSKQLKDYRLNHDCNALEIDANKYGWKLCQKFYSKYYTGKQKDVLINNCYKNANTSYIRRIFAYKQDNDGNYIPYDEYDISNLLKIIRNNSEYVNKYPMLKHIFLPDGKFRMKLLFENNYTSSDNIMEIVNYFFISGGPEALKKYILNNDLSLVQIDNLICNLYASIKRKFKSFDDLNYMFRMDNMGEYKNLYISSSDSFDKLSKRYFDLAYNNYQDFIDICGVIQQKYPQMSGTINTYVDLLKDILIKTESKKISKK